LPFHTEKVHCDHIFRGHDPLLIDLREKWGLGDEKAVARSSSVSGIRGWTRGSSRSGA
jgi:hypothetical protein